MRPRRRYFWSLSTGFALLAALGMVLHYAAGRLRSSAIRVRIDALEARVRALEQSDPTTSDEILHGRQIGDASNIRGSREVSTSPLSAPPLVRPRLLGRGRTGGWFYSDLRLPDGEVRRYYARTNAPPAELLQLLGNIRADIEDHPYKAEIGAASFSLAD